MREEQFVIVHLSRDGRQRGEGKLTRVRILVKVEDGIHVPTAIFAIRTRNCAGSRHFVLLS